MLLAFLLVLCVGAYSSDQSDTDINVLCVGAFSADAQLLSDATLGSFLNSIGTTVAGLLTDISTIVEDNNFVTTGVIISKQNVHSACLSGTKVLTAAGYSVSLVYISTPSVCDRPIPTSCDNTENCENVFEYLDGYRFSFSTELPLSSVTPIDTDYVIVVMGNNYASYFYQGYPLGVSL